MKRHAHSFVWFLFWGLALLAALCAAGLLGLKLLINDLSSYRTDIETRLSQALNAEVRIAEIQGGWQGWQPEIRLRGLSVTGIEEAEGAALALLDADMAVDPQASLKAGTLVFSRFDLDGLKLRYILPGSPESESAEPAPGKAQDHAASQAGSNLLAFLLQQRALNIRNTRFELQQPDGETVSVSPVQLQLQNDGFMRQMKIGAELVTDRGRATISFVAEVEGNPSEDPVNFYLQLNGLDQQLLNPWLGLADIELERFQGEQQIWGRSYRGKLVYLNGITSIEGFRFRDYSLDQAQLHTALVRRDRGYQLQLTDLRLDAEQQAIELPRISLDLIRQGRRIQPLKLMVEQLDLDKLSDWLVQQPAMPPKVAEIVKTLSPQGALQNLAISWSESAALKDFKLEADLHDVGIKAWDDVPEIEGINGLLQADSEGGQIHLVSQRFAMHYPTLFDYKWQYQQADGVIGWRMEEKGVVVASQLLHLKDPHVSASGRFSIYLPFSRDEQPLLNLQIGMQQSDGLQAKYYIPPKEVGQGTYDWLVRAIQGGRIRQAGFILNGVTRSRLDDYQLPAVQMFFNLEQASFEYQPGWPAVKGADAFVFFRNGELVAEATGGKLYDSGIDFAWVHLPQKADRLLVAGATRGNAADLQRLLSESPLREEVGDDLNVWQMAGSATTLLDLKLPLYTGNIQPRVKVTSVIRDGRFRSEVDRIDFTGVTGQVNFDSATGLSADKLSARLFEQPVSASINTRDRKTQVYIDGSVEADYLRRWLDLELLRIASGHLPFQARLDLCPGKTCNQLVINSQLQGVALQAPAPLGKTANETMEFSLVSDLGRQFADNRSAIRLNLGGQLRGVLVTEGQAVERARFTLGGERPDLPEEPGIWLDGRLAELEYEQLQQFLVGAGFVAAEGKSDAQSTDTADSGLVKQIDLDIGRFRFGDFAVEGVTASLAPFNRDWLLSLKSQQVVGTLLLPADDQQAYRADLAYLRLQTREDTEDTAAEPAESGERLLEPESLPKLDFSVKRLQYNGKPMGQWQFQLRPGESGAEVRDIKADIEGSKLLGQIRWDTREQEQSELTLKLTGDDFGRVLDLWGISDTLETKSLDAYLQLAWPGAPWQFGLSGAAGELQFTAGQGRLLDVGNSGNFLRVFGILNLSSLGRRLKLDFSDLLKTGVAFDQMKASYNISKGIARTRDDFVMTGPSANLVMRGSLDLVNETVDKDIEVALPVTGNIPLVSVLLGAPQVAGAVFLFDKLVGDPLAKFTTVKYHLSGDWGNPEVELFSDKAKSKTETAKPSNLLDQEINQ
ncbi:YhdP family protein [Neptuniibacter halophilus]|uniref:YhdP family protein n=1 Tax=Neptuniibacter halophilus TaxID=651666 RepID=UPI002574134E|nr:YhdP family protein [Neptuniibacter halophilus]